MAETARQKAERKLNVYKIQVEEITRRMKQQEERVVELRKQESAPIKKRIGEVGFQHEALRKMSKAELQDWFAKAVEMTPWNVQC